MTLMFKCRVQTRKEVDGIVKAPIKTSQRSSWRRPRDYKTRANPQYVLHTCLRWHHQPSRLGKGKGVTIERQKGQYALKPNPDASKNVSAG
jgi:hypothetical protein